MRSFFGRNFAERLNRFDVRRHQRKRFIDAAFTLAQRLHRFVVRRIAGEMKPAQPFYRDNLTLSQSITHFPNR